MSYLRDNQGRLSHHRLLVIMCVPAIVLLPLGVWAGISLAGGKMAEMPLTITGYIGAANAILLTYAGFHKHQEGRTSAPPPTP